MGMTQAFMCACVRVHFAFLLLPMDDASLLLLLLLTTMTQFLFALAQRY
jgi:hypothetical protein